MRRWLLLPLLLIVACGGTPETRVGRVASDREVEREATIVLQQDPRFSDLWVQCTTRMVTVTGRVVDGDAAEEALRRVRPLCGGRELRNQIEVRGRP